MKRLRALLFFFAGIFIAGGAAFALLYFVIPLDPKEVNRIEASSALYDSRGRLFHMRLSSNSEWQIPIPLAEIEQWLPVITVSVEGSIEVSG